MREIILRRLGTRDYLEVWQAMRAFTEGRADDTADEIWLLEHTPVFTLGQVGRPEHLLAPGTIPVIHVDRGGQVTYHGPGQLVAYTLLDLPRAGLGIRRLVSLLERSMIELLGDYGIGALARPEAPGVYVDGRKIGSIGLRVRRGRCYHGLSLNVAMDLAPFRRIHPCGEPGLEMTQLSELVRDWGGPGDLAEASERLAAHMCRLLSHAEVPA